MVGVGQKVQGGWWWLERVGADEIILGAVVAAEKKITFFRQAGFPLTAKEEPLRKKTQKKPGLPPLTQLGWGVAQPTTQTPSVEVWFEEGGLEDKICVKNFFWLIKTVNVVRRI